MALSFTKHQPRKGQFVALWEYEGKPWSSTFKLEDGFWSRYRQEDDTWEYVQHPNYHIPLSNEYVKDIRYAVIR